MFDTLKPTFLICRLMFIQDLWQHSCEPTSMTLCPAQLPMSFGRDPFDMRAIQFQQLLDVVSKHRLCLIHDHLRRRTSPSHPMFFKQISQQHRCLLFEKRNHLLKTWTLIYNVQGLHFLIGLPSWEIFHIKTNNLIEDRGTTWFRRQWHMWLVVSLAEFALKLPSKLQGFLGSTSMLQNPTQVLRRWMS